MSAHEPKPWTAFAGTERVASGEPGDVALACKSLIDEGDIRPLLIFDDETAEQVEVDFRGSSQDVLGRLAERMSTSSSGDSEGGTGSGGREAAVGTASGAASGELPGGTSDVTPTPRPPGRPKLGVVGREVTLLPRHWEWLGRQPGGASVTLRKLVEQARKANYAKDRVRHAQEVAYRFMSAIAGNEPGFEEASRALFAGDCDRFEEHSRSWPPDVRAYAMKLAADVFEDSEGSPPAGESRAPF